MSLDIHVMPLWMFWAGEYTTAAERMAQRSGFSITRIGREKEQYDDQEARKLAVGVRRWIEQTSTRPAWEDDGEIVFSEQFQFEAIHAVRAYAAHLDTSDGTFELITDFHLSPATKRIAAGVPTRFPHPMYHEDNAGFYVPVPFSQPRKLMGNPPWVGSSVQLMMELAALRRSLGDFPTYEELGSGMELGEEHPGLAWVKHGVAFLYRASWLSVQSRLPIIFNG